MANNDGATTHDRVLDAAVHLFATVGMPATTLDDVARAARVGADDVRRLYPTIDALVTAVLMRRDDRDVEFVPLLERAGGLEILRRLEDLTAGHVADVESAVVFTSTVAGAVVPQHPARAWAVQRYQWARSLYAAAFRRDIDAGLIRQDVDPDALAVQVLAVMDGLQIQWLLDPENVDMAQALATALETIIDSVKTLGT